jgi:hypothetical protein
MPTVVSTDGPKRGRRAQERGRPAARARDAGEYRARLAILPGRPDRSPEIYRHLLVVVLMVSPPENRRLFLTINRHRPHALAYRPRRVRLCKLSEHGLPQAP